MEKFKKIETEVEQFLPNYFLPEEEQMQVVPETVVPLLLGVVCAGVCGLSFFLWMTTFSGNSVVAGSMNKTHETTVAGDAKYISALGLPILPLKFLF
jgi:hypothetical protein